MRTRRDEPVDSDSVAEASTEPANSEESPVDTSIPDGECRHCGAANDPTYRYCRRCGERL